MTSRSDQGMKNYSLNEMGPQEYATLHIFIHLEMIMNLGLLFHLKLIFCFLNWSFQKGSFRTSSLCFKSTCFPVRFSRVQTGQESGCRARSAKRAMQPCSAGSSAMPERRTRIRSMHWDRRQAQGRADAREF